MSKGNVEFTSWNFVQGDGVLFSDRDLFFGPGNNEVEELAGDMIDIMVATGVFFSKSAARKNGWGKDREPILVWKDRGQFCVVQRPGRRVPKGFTHFRAGKGKATEIAILRIDIAV
jgi:hypothetical protein